ncbi:MAG TPA: molybdopterin-synthase adenylyltransferase MoeB [Vicinamibacterales bacterium]
MQLTPVERQRYSRHLLLPEIGEAGQRRLKAARVLCVGAGGLGSPALLYLAAAGVGTIGIADGDAVDDTNLQRQIIHGAADVGRAKTASARDRIASINPGVCVETCDERFSVANAQRFVGAFDIVVDGTDNFPARYLVNDACVLYGKPNVWGSVHRFEGQASVFAAPGGPCYRCLHPEPPPSGLVPSCAEAGVLGVLPGLVGTIQATEAIKMILGIGEPLVGRVLLYDALRMRLRTIVLRKDPDCPVCGTRPSIASLREEEAYCDTGPTDSPLVGMTAAQLKARIDGGGAPAILDVREAWETAICRIPGAILIPLGELAQRSRELDPAVEVVVYCQAGGRSARAVDLLRSHGFAGAVNLAGGIRGWLSETDPSGPHIETGSQPPESRRQFLRRKGGEQ